MLSECRNLLEPLIRPSDATEFSLQRWFTTKKAELTTSQSEFAAAHRQISDVVSELHASLTLDVLERAQQGPTIKEIEKKLKELFDDDRKVLGDKIDELMDELKQVKRLLAERFSKDDFKNLVLQEGDVEMTSEVLGRGGQNTIYRVKYDGGDSVAKPIATMKPAEVEKTGGEVLLLCNMN